MRGSKMDTKFIIDTKKDTKKYKIFWYHFKAHEIKFNGALKIRHIHDHNK